MMERTAIIRVAGRSFSCAPGESVLGAQERGALGLIPVGCRGGGCGICRVQVTSGRYRRGRMSRCSVSEADEADGVALACRLYPITDLELRLAATAPLLPWTGANAS